MESSSTNSDCDSWFECEHCGFVTETKHIFCPSCKKLTFSAYPWRAFSVIFGLNILILATLVYMRIEWGVRAKLDLVIAAYSVVIIVYGTWTFRIVRRITAIRRGRRIGRDL